MLNVFVTCGIFLSFPDSSMGHCIWQGPDRKEEVHTYGESQESLTKEAGKLIKDDEAPEFSSRGPKRDYRENGQSSGEGHLPGAVASMDGCG